MPLLDVQIRHLDSLVKRYREVESLMAAPDVASDPDRLKTLGMEFSELSDICTLYTHYRTLLSQYADTEKSLETETDEDMRALFEDEFAALTDSRAAIEAQLDELLSADSADLNKPIIIEIRSGTGGDEASLFAGDLFRMYTRFSEIQGWKTDVISASPTPMGGYKEAVLSIRGRTAFQLMKYESGVHRVQRIPVTETNGRIHTSAATVAVLVEPDEMDIQIDPSELRVDTFRASGAGGQHVNKTESAIRVTHIPTGIAVECQDERSQHQNRAKAMRLIRARILDVMQQEQQAKISEDRRTQVGSGDRSERIRTYNFPQNRVTDHRAGLTLYQLDLIMEGELASLLDQLQKFMKEQFATAAADSASASVDEA